MIHDKNWRDRRNNLTFDLSSGLVVDDNFLVFLSRPPRTWKVRETCLSVFKLLSCRWCRCGILHFSGLFLSLFYHDNSIYTFLYSYILFNWKLPDISLITFKSMDNDIFSLYWKSFQGFVNLYLIYNLYLHNLFLLLSYTVTCLKMEKAAKLKLVRDSVTNHPDFPKPGILFR